jgi:hypothetical protein
MKRITLAIWLLSILSITANAQEAPRIEIFGGYFDLMEAVASTVGTPRLPGTLTGGLGLLETLAGTTERNRYTRSLHSPTLRERYQPSPIATPACISFCSVHDSHIVGIRE